MQQSKLVLSIAFIACLLGTAGCKHSAEAAKTERNAAVDPLKVQISPELQSSIIIGKPQWQQVTTEQKVAARIQTDASRVARIGSSVDGRITRMLVFEGQKVKQGQVLAMLHSNALSDTQFAFVKALYHERSTRGRCGRTMGESQSGCHTPSLLGGRSFISRRFQHRRFAVNCLKPCSLNMYSLPS